MYKTGPMKDKAGALLYTDGQERVKNRKTGVILGWCYLIC